MWDREWIGRNISKNWMNPGSHYKLLNLTSVEERILDYQEKINGVIKLYKAGTGDSLSHALKDKKDNDTVVASFAKNFGLCHPF